MRNHIMIGCWLLCAAGSTASAEVLRVDTGATGISTDGVSWETAFTSIGDAMASATPGDEIWVAAGVYEESVEYVSGIAMYGGFMGDEQALSERDVNTFESVIDSSSFPSPRHSVTAATDSRLDGFTVTGGDANESGTDGGGAPLSGGTGGGVLIENVGFTIANCFVANNSAKQRGGGIYVRNGFLTLENTVVVDNETESGGSGGGIALDGSSLTAVSSRLTRNSSAGVGGALFGLRSSLVLDRCFVLDNNSVTGAGIGLLSEANLSAVNCVIGRNTAVSQGGGIFAQSFASAMVSFDYCTLVGNEAPQGGAVTLFGMSTLEVSNSIVWENGSDEILPSDESASTISNSIIRGGHTGSGNLDIDPRLRINTGDFPFMLGWDSPAQEVALPGVIAVDIQSNQRPQNGAPDMGAYEFGEDSDGGGLPDEYEELLGLDPDDNADDAVDSDLDRLTNLEEFNRNTDPFDDADPPSEFYVESSGSDETGDGSLGNPWLTISWALDQAPEGTALFPITIHVGTGIYEESLTINAHTVVSGAGQDITTIQFFAGSDTKIAVMSEGSGIENLTLTTPAAEIAVITFLESRFSSFRSSGVRFFGKNNPFAVGILVEGVSDEDSVIANCLFEQIGFGVRSFDAAPIVRENDFQTIFDTAILVSLPNNGKQDSATPLVGDVDDARTGFNTFSDVTEFFVQNVTDSVVKAELNYWGTESSSEIDAQMTANVDYDPFFGKVTIPATLVGTVTDEETGAPIQGATVEIQAGTYTVEVITDTEGNFQVPAVEPESVSVRVSANSYCDNDQTRFLIAGDITDLNIHMSSETGGCKMGTTGCGASPASQSDRDSRGTLVTLLLCVALLLHRGRRSAATRRKIQQ